MSKTILVLGATGQLGQHVARQAIAAGHAVSVLVRNPLKLPPGVKDRVSVHRADLGTAAPAELAQIMRGHDAVINTAGYVTEGDQFVALVDKVISSLESLPAAQRPVCWFLAGAALLDLVAGGRKGVDLPVVRRRYWPHSKNFERLRRTDLDWRMLCPGPLVDEAAVGLAAMRVSLDSLPVPMPAWSAGLPAALSLLPFVKRLPQMTVPYADAAALMLANLAPDSDMSRRRVGLALPLGMVKTKKP